MNSKSESLECNGFTFTRVCCLRRFVHLLVDSYVRCATSFVHLYRIEGLKRNVQLTWCHWMNATALSIDYLFIKQTYESTLYGNSPYFDWSADTRQQNRQMRRNRCRSAYLFAFRRHIRLNRIRYKNEKCNRFYFWGVVATNWRTIGYLKSLHTLFKYSSGMRELILHFESTRMRRRTKWYVVKVSAYECASNPIDSCQISNV